jgi:hypothetical protein
MLDHLAEFRMQETSSLDTLKLPTDEQVERACSAAAQSCGRSWAETEDRSEFGWQERDAWRAQIKAQLTILLNKDRILGYDRL